jgi:hypothetical protein
MTQASALIHARSPIADNPISALKKNGKGVQFSLSDVSAESNSEAKTGSALGQIKPAVTGAGQGNLLSSSLLAQLGS